LVSIFTNTGTLAAYIEIVMVLPCEALADDVGGIEPKRGFSPRANLLRGATW
jgi:hypothetical protein